MREVLTSSDGGPCTFSSPMTFDGSVWVRAPGAEQIRGQSNNSNEAGGKLSQVNSKTLQLNGQSAPTGFRDISAPSKLGP